MKTPRTALALLLVLWAGFALYVLTTAPQLPERVATHFDAAGRPNGWMTRAQHTGFTLAAGATVPAFILGIFAFIRRCQDYGLNIPHKAYWLAPERRDETFAFIQRQGYWLAALLIAFFAAIHHSILAANALTPSRLYSIDALWASGGLLGAMAIWFAVFLGRFLRKPA